MSDIAVKVEGLGKKYHIGRIKPGSMNLREAIYRGLKSPLSKAWNLMHGKTYAAAQLEEEIWALRGVDFEVKRGETLGIIGHNGAGKSTLLKIITHITEPSEGMVMVRGRAGALLEVGTGIHPELTGRENIYLNGSILGMKRSEVKKKFDEIVEFSGIERFLETPMKHYSDGMRVRLAFSVAAHLEPEILLVDEVLAVGDTAFQKKCLGKMGEVIKEGRTVLFVSHNMAAIKELCPRTILLSKGKVLFDGPSYDAISSYLAQDQVEKAPCEDKDVSIIRTYFPGAETAGEGVVHESDEPLICGVEFHAEKEPEEIWVNLEMFSVEGTRLVHIRNDFDAQDLRVKPGRTNVEITITDLPLLPDTYSIRFRLVAIIDGEQHVEDSVNVPLIISGGKPGQGRYEAFVKTKQTWRVRHSR